MIAAMYLRKSRAEEQEPVAETLRRHRDALSAFASTNGIVVAAVYEEVASGDSLYGRPQMLLLLSELDKYDAVLCMDIDRLGRGAMHEQGLILESLRDASVLVVTPGKTYNLNDDIDDSLISFKALFAREEYKLIRGRLRRGVLKTIQDGGYVANAPYGYTKTRKDKRPTLVIEEAEAAAVRMIFDMYCSGSGCQIIADTLNSLGYNPRRTDKFGRTTVAKILRNPVYIGKVAWNQCTFKRPKRAGEKHVRTLNDQADWILVDGIHDAIIAEDVYKQANAILEGRYHPPYRKPDELKNPLSGILYCRNCGRIMVRQALYNRPYNQPVIMCQTKGCCMSSNQNIVEQLFYSALQVLLDDIKTHGHAKPSHGPADYDSIVAAAKAEISRLEAQFATLHDFLERGVYDVDTFLQRREELQSRITASRQTITTARRTPPADVLIARLESVLAAYWTGSALERNNLVKTVVSRAEYSKPKNSKYNTPPKIEITEWSLSL